MFLKNKISYLKGVSHQGRPLFNLGHLKDILEKTSQPVMVYGNRLSCTAEQDHVVTFMAILHMHTCENLMCNVTESCENLVHRKTLILVEMLKANF